MKKLALYLAVTLLGLQVFGQNFDIPAFGTDSTLEVVTWNIEHFPKNGQTTIDYVKEIILDLNVDIIAMQELEDRDALDQMVAGMQGYECNYESGYFAGLAYIYNSAVIEVDTIYEVLTSQPYWRPFPRSPMIMEFIFKGERYIVINNHFKCCGDGYLDMSDDWDEEKRRLDASLLLKEYIDVHFEGKNVILTGDLNDLIQENPTNNVFNCFIDDPDYMFVDMGIAQGDEFYWSYPSWPSHLDHVLINQPLFDDFANEGSAIETIRLDDHFSSWNQYDYNVTDHRPVAIRINPDSSLGENEFIAKTLFTVYPNPVRNQVTFTFQSVTDSRSEIIIFNAEGTMIETINVQNNQSSLLWDASGLIPGSYISIFKENNMTKSSCRFVVVD